MKRFAAMLIASACLFSLAACGSQSPSPEEVEQAIEAGSLTIEDALDKGWVSQEWVDDYTEQRSVPASNKLEANIVSDFTTTTLSGEEFTKEQLGNVVFFVFLDPTDETAETFYQALVESYEGVKKNGAEIVVCTKDEAHNEIFDAAPFQVILYNDSLKEAVSTNSDMIEEIPNTASWYVNGSFLSAWYTKVDATKLADSAAAFVEMQKEMGGQDSGDNGGMAVMGE